MHPLILVPALALALGTAACAPTMPEMGMAYDGGVPGAATPAMAAERKVSEQDCSQPIEFFTGNLRCK